jgi:hypothetical protein
MWELGVPATLDDQRVSTSSVYFGMGLANRATQLVAFLKLCGSIYYFTNLKSGDFGMVPDTNHQLQ